MGRFASDRLMLWTFRRSEHPVLPTKQLVDHITQAFRHTGVIILLGSDVVAHCRHHFKTLIEEVHDRLGEPGVGL